MTTRNTVISLTALASCASSCAAQVPAAVPLPAVAPLPAATSLLPAELGTFKSYGQGPQTSSAALVPVEGQPFREALRLTTFTEPPRFWDYGSTIPLTAPIRAGDVLWVSLWARRITTRKESGEAQVEVALLQKVGDREVRPLERVLSFGSQWTQFTLPFVVKNDSELGAARLGLRFGYGPQSFEIGGFRLLNYGPNVALTDLPRTQVRYEGWEANAPWRQAAAERIEKYRKGDLTVKLVDGQGRPVSGAQVQVRMKRHAFGWGTAINDQRLNDRSSPDNDRYRQTIEKYFNKVVFENNMKWGRWMQPQYRDSVLKALPWLKERDIAVRGHVMLWPSWRQTPRALFTEEVKKDPAAIKKLIDDHIDEQTTAMRGQLKEWDVINETFMHHDVMDVIGRGAMTDWFRRAKAGAPDVKLFYNDYTMFQKGEGSDYFYKTVKELKESGAPIDAIGEQGHFASSPPGIPDVLATLDKFGGLGLPIQITEYDIDTDDAGLQSDFMRDFTTAVFSHPSVMGVVQWGFWEKSHWLPRGALWDNDWNLRPHGKVWVDLTTKTWWTDADGATDRDGSYKTRGFYGDYEVTVTKDGKTTTSKLTLSPQNGALVVTLPG